MKCPIHEIDMQKTGFGWMEVRDNFSVGSIDCGVSEVISTITENYICLFGCRFEGVTEKQNFEES